MMFTLICEFEEEDSAKEVLRLCERLVAEHDGHVFLSGVGDEGDKFGLKKGGSDGDPV